MGFDLSKDTYFGGAAMTEQEIKAGIAELSLESHNFISSLVYKNDENSTLDRPFETIGNAYRFAFSLGYSKGIREKLSVPKKDIGVRGFRPEEFKVLVVKECIEENLSLGALISEYAESGSKELSKCIGAGENILQLLDPN